jgi:hypothetical protein
MASKLMLLKDLTSVNSPLAVNLKYIFLNFVALGLENVKLTGNSEAPCSSYYFEPAA